MLVTDTLYRPIDDFVKCALIFRHPNLTFSIDISILNLILPLTGNLVTALKRKSLIVRLSALTWHQVQIQDMWENAVVTFPLQRLCRWLSAKKALDTICRAWLVEH